MKFFTKIPNSKNVSNCKKIPILLVLILFIVKAAYSQCTAFKTPGVSTYTVPSGVTNIRIVARGADGALQSRLGSNWGNGGSGAVIIATFSVQMGDVITMYIGSAGTYNSNYGLGGGGGGTGVVLTRGSNNYLLMVAGGGGGGSRGTGAATNPGGAGLSTVSVSPAGGAGYILADISSGGSGYGYAGSTGSATYIDATPAQTVIPSTGALPSIASGGSVTASYLASGASGGNGFGAGGAGISSLGGGGGGYAGGNGSNASSSHSTGGTSYCNTSSFSGTIVQQIDGVNGGVNTTAGSLGLNGEVDIQTPASGIYTNIWSGGISTATSNGLNWCGYTPSSSFDVVIPSGTTFAPIVSGTDNYNNFTINSSAALTVTGILKITGTTTNYGTLTVTSPGKLTAGNGITVNAGGALVGNSSNITGNVTLQQSIIAQRGWRMFANPFTTSQTFATVATNNAISIQTTGSSNAAGIADNRTFSNSTNTWSDGGTTVAANTPYALFLRGLASEVTGLTYTGGPTAFTYNVSGTLNGSSVSVTPNNASNFMLVGNPYAAPVNSKALTGQTAGTNYYVYTITQSGTQSGQRTNAGSWVAAGSSSNTTNTIPVLGVLAYQPASTSTFNITTSDINTGGTLQTGLFGVQTAEQQIELQVEQNGDFRDKLFVRLDANSTASGKERTDLLKFYNDNVNVYTINKDENTRMAIDARNVLNNIPLGISALKGDYNFKLSSNNLPEGTIVYLNDKLLKTQTELKTGDTYPFTISSDASTMGEQRFELVFSSKKTNITVDAGNSSFTANVLGNITNGNLIAVQIEGATTPVTISVKDMSGKALGTMSATNGIQYVNIGNAAKGILLLQISDGKSSVVKKLVKF